MKLIKGNKSEWGDKWVNFTPGINWASGPMIAYDLETTAVNPEIARMVQAAIVLDIPGTDPIIHQWLINPGIDIPLDATAVHGINTESVQEYGIETDIAIRGILDILMMHKNYYPNAPLVLVNAPYDITITDRELRRTSHRSKLQLDKLPLIVDTLTCDRKLDPYRVGRRTLTATSAAYEIAIAGAHQAANDCLCAIKLARAMGVKYPAFGSCDLNALQEMQKLAHTEWIQNYIEFRKMNDPEFNIVSNWPLIRMDESETRIS
jgi:DNA polymerase III subunit epsilon